MRKGLLQPANVTATQRVLAGSVRTADQPVERDGHRVAHGFHEHHSAAGRQVLAVGALEKGTPIDVMQDGTTDHQVEVAVEGIVKIMKPVLDPAFAVATLLGLSRSLSDRSTARTSLAPSSTACLAVSPVPQPASSTLPRSELLRRSAERRAVRHVRCWEPERRGERADSRRPTARRRCPRRTPPARSRPGPSLPWFRHPSLGDVRSLRVLVNAAVQNPCDDSLASPR